MILLNFKPTMNCFLVLGKDFAKNHNLLHILSKKQLYKLFGIA